MTMSDLETEHKIFESKIPCQSLPAACELAGVYSLKLRVRWARRLHWKYAEKISPALAGDGENATTRPPP